MRKTGHYGAMSIRIRPYDHPRDFARVSRFLVEIYEPGDVCANWLQPRWEYMHFHPLIAGQSLERIGVAELGGEIVGVANFEHSLAFVYFQIRPGFDEVKPGLLAHAEKHFGGWSHSLQRNVLGLFIDEMDLELTSLAAAAGFVENIDLTEYHARLDLGRPLPNQTLPDGFRLQSLEEENDLARIDRCLHRGFNHPGEPPATGIAERAYSQSAPNFRKDLTIVAVSPEGDYVSFGGMWVVPENRVAYVEPVATDPQYRMRGLGKAVVLETLRRAAADGAEVAWVGSDQDFYKKMGFQVRFTSRLWIRDV